MSIREQFTDRDGYSSLIVGGAVHTLDIFTTDPGRPTRHPLAIQIDGLSQAFVPLDQEDIDALHAFLGRYVSKEKDDG